MTNESVALQQALIEASIQDRHSLELDPKFDKADNFDWWYHQVRGHLQHEAWQKNIIPGGEPYATVDANRAMPNKLCQRLH
jgi:hypothetical protein